MIKSNNMDKVKIPTARSLSSSVTEAEKLKNFAKLHVLAALSAASEQAELSYADGKYDCPDYCEELLNMTCDDLGNYHYINRNSILNAYPIDKIK